MTSDMSAGDRVRCVDGRFVRDRQLPYAPEDLHLPVEDGTYVVREVVVTPFHGTGIRLVEIRNRPFRHDVGGVREPCFSPSRFVRDDRPATGS